MWEETQLGPQLTKGIFHTIYSHAQHIKLGEEGGKTSGIVGVCLLKSPLSWVEPCFPGCGSWLNTCLDMGRGEWNPRVALLVCVAFVFPVPVSLSQPLSFLPFALSVLSPSYHGWISKWLSGPWLPVGVKSQHCFVQSNLECLKKRSGVVW